MNPTDTPPIDTENALRHRLTELLEQIRACLGDVPELRPTSPPPVLDATAELLDLTGQLLIEATELNVTLRTLEGLSLEGALVAGAVVVAISAVTDVLSVLRAALDDRLAA